MDVDIEELRRRRADLALGVLEGTEDQSVLEAADAELDLAARWAEWDAAAEEARERREAEQRTAEREAADDRERKRLQGFARSRLAAAEDVERAFAALVSAVEAYRVSSAPFHDNGRPVVWWLQWQMSGLFPRDFSRPPAPQRTELVTGEQDRLRTYLNEEE